jgi:hypothetical protein
MFIQRNKLGIYSIGPNLIRFDPIDYSSIGSIDMFQFSKFESCLIVG